MSGANGNPVGHLRKEWQREVANVKTVRLVKTHMQSFTCTVFKGEQESWGAESAIAPRLANLQE
jgi:hypothetical protein